MYETIGEINIMTIEEIKMFKTIEDNQIFESKSAAMQHIKELKIKKNLDTFVEKYFYSGILKEDIIDMLYENLDELIKILEGK